MQTLFPPWFFPLEQHIFRRSIWKPLKSDFHRSSPEISHVTAAFMWFSFESMYVFERAHYTNADKDRLQW